MRSTCIKIAIQKSGRLNQPSVSFLDSLGLQFGVESTSLIQMSTNFDLSVVLVRDDDIPVLVSRGIVDFGIVGQNILLEENTEAKTLMPLGFGKCTLTIAAPKTSSIKNSKDLEGLRIATAYPRLLRKYLKKNNINATIIEIAGSAEIAPELNFADAICDLVQTGKTLKDHDLFPIATVMDSQAVLIESPFQKEKKKEFLELIKNI